MGIPVDTQAVPPAEIPFSRSHTIRILFLSPPGEVIGYDLEKDRQRFTVTENGVVVIPKGMVIR